MAAAPRPKEVRRKLGELLEEIQIISKEYAWAHGYAYGGTSAGNRFERPMRRSGAGTSDPTLNTIEDGRKDAARDAAKEAADEVERAREALVKARRVLHEATAGGRAAKEPIGATVTGAELRRIHEAKARRDARGEGFGDG